MANPARHDGAVDLHLAARVNVGLAMQREMVAVFRDEDMGEQSAGPGRPFSIGSVGMGACTTVPQARQLIFGAHMQHALEV